MTTGRCKKIRALMEARGYECLLATPGPNLRYLTGVRYIYPGDPWDMEIVWDMMTVALLPVDGEPILFAPENNESWLRQVSTVKDIRTYHGLGSLIEMLREPLGRLKGPLGIEPQLPYRVYAPLAESFPGIRMKDSTEMLSELRLIKSPEEIECMRKAARVVERGVTVGREFIRESVTERDISIEVESAMRKQGAESISYCVVQTGAKTATWDPPTDDRVKKGDSFLMDLSATVEGYHADITRVSIVGRASEKQKKVHQLIMAAQAAAIGAIKPGAKAGVVNDAGKAVIERGGHGEHFPFGIGHGLGLEPHEIPHLTEYRNTELILQPGMVMTIEPTINLPGQFGMRVEDDMLVTSEGSESLTKLGKELVEL